MLCLCALKPILTRVQEQAKLLAQVGVSYVEAPSSPQQAQTSGQTLFRVMAGSYAVGENAEKQVEKD